MCRVALLQLALWATSVQAFFPFTPSYACDTYHGCVDQNKRALQPNSPPSHVVKDSDPGELLTFKLFQRASSGNQDVAARVSRQAERLRRQFGFVGVSNTVASSSSDSQKRDNTFSVDSAETPTATNSVGIDQDGSDISYFVEAGVGSAGKPLYLLCDTGAGTTWIMSADCESTACLEHTTWSSSGSKTYTATGESFSIAYGTGSVEGSIAEDDITIGSVKVNMKFGLANVTSDDFTHFAFDGILGLSMANGSSDNFIDTLKSNKVLTSNMFSVDLNRHSDGYNTGELTFGGTDAAKFTGDITYTPVDSAANGDWAIPLGDLAYDDTKAGITDRLAYIDTGTTYAFAPPKDAAALHKLIPGANSTDGTTYTVPCSIDKPIIVTFSGVDHEISVKDWLSSPSSSGICTSNIYGQEVVSGAWLLGDVFLKNVYTVFDADASQIGFATKANKTATSTSTSASATSTSTSTKTSGSVTAAAESAGATQSAGATKTSASGAGSHLGSQPSSKVLFVVAIIIMVAPGGYVFGI